MYKSDLLNNKAIIVTGGGTGLGRSMATRFAQLGASVAIVSRKLEVLTETAAEISDLTGNEVLPLQLDIRQYRDIEKVIATVVDKFGPIYGLVNNAAGNFLSPTELLTFKAFDTIVDIVLRGTYYFSLAMGKHWIAEGQPGTMLNIVTTYASTGSGFVVPSSISKAGVLNLTRSLAAEWGHYGIRTNAIAPGPFPTKGAWDRLVPNPAMEKAMTERIPLGRVGDHDELANLATYLMSDGSSYINGEVVTIDGGEWLAGAGEFNFLNALSPEEWAEFKKNLKR